MSRILHLKYWLAFTILMTCAVVGWNSRQTMLIGLGHWLDVGSAPHAVDWVMVLPGGESTRPFVAAGMVRRQQARGILVPTNAASPLNQDGVLPDTFDIIRQILEARDVPHEQIVALNVESETTWEDARSLSKFLNEHRQDRVAVVTNGFHTRRARWVFAQIVGTNAERLSFVSAPSEDCSADDWWRTKLGLQTYVGEYCKFGFYLLRYGDAGVWIAVMFFVLAGIAVRYRVGRRRNLTLE